ncbi:hypothetical protein AWV80_30075 [Cupriavidus sp. UYMU48A]|nr:hypothetical protein AWV80_30075 [Cupriavidus sp. UYMU48A]
MLAQEAGERGVVGQQQLAPALDQVHACGLGLAGALETFERAADGLDLVVVQAAHDLAHELHLAPLAFVAGGAARFVDGVSQCFRHRHAGQAVLGQGFQLDAKVLQGGHVALLLRLALGLVHIGFRGKGARKPGAGGITGISRHGRHFILL